MTVLVFYCHNRYSKPRTGGEWVHHHTYNYLASQPDIDFRELDEDGIEDLKTTEIGLKVPFQFLKRLWRLPSHTIIVQASESYLQLFVANWLLKLRRNRPKILILVHSDPYLGNMNWKGVVFDGFCFKMHVRSADRLIANSLDTRRRLIKLGVRSEKIVVITPPAQALPMPRRIEKQNSVKQIICPANIDTRKGQKILVEAMHRIHDNQVTAIFPGLVKDTKYHQELRSLVSQYGLEHRIRFAGYLEGYEMAEAYSQSSICVIPSLHDSYGMTVQEAMRFGLPVIASRVGGLTEQIEDGINGILVPPGDPGALAKAIQCVVNDSNLRECLVNNAKEKTKTFPTWVSVMERTCNVIREMAIRRHQLEE